MRFLLLVLLLPFASAQFSGNCGAAFPANVGNDVLYSPFKGSGFQTSQGVDDTFYPIPWPSGTPNVRFFGDDYGAGQVYIGSNGIVSLGSGVRNYTPIPFPQSFRVIAPFWGDVDPRGGSDSLGANQIHYGVTTNAGLLERFACEVQEKFSTSFVPTHLVIATWEGVRVYRYSSSTTSNLRNTFQAVIGMDGSGATYVMYHYPTNKINWTFGSASGGVHAQIGFDKGDNTNHFTVAISRTPSVANVETTSNVGEPGKYIFLVSEDQISGAGDCDPGETECGEQCCSGSQVCCTGTAGGAQLAMQVCCAPGSCVNRQQAGATGQQCQGSCSDPDCAECSSSEPSSCVLCSFGDLLSGQCWQPCD